MGRCSTKEYAHYSSLDGSLYDMIFIDETVDEKTAAEVQQLSTRIYKSDRFKTFLTQSNVDLGTPIF